MSSRSLLLLLCFLLDYFGLFAQVNISWPNQEYMFFTVNPAMTADVDAFSIGVTHGRRWSRIKSSPSQSGLGMRLPFKEQKMGLGAHIFSDKVGPLAGNGVDLSYAYRISTGLSYSDQLALGMSIRLMQLRFDQNHLIASVEEDFLIDNIDPKEFVPPSLNIGFKYTSGVADYAHPVQMIFAASANRFLPFEDRFNTLSLDRPLQWHGLFALQIAASSSVLVEPGLFMSNVDKTAFNYAFRVKTSFENLGWIMAQISKAGFLTTQIGVDLGDPGRTGSLVRLSVGNSWYFGTLAAQLGNSVTFGFSYHRPIRN